jgi:hypothetical protein
VQVFLDLARRISVMTSLSRRSSTSRICQPNWLRTGVDISPAGVLAMVFSNSGTICPLTVQPRSPPSAAEPMSSEYSRASVAKSSPASMRAFSSAARSRACSSVRISDGLIRIWRTCVWRTVRSAPRRSAMCTICQPLGLRNRSAVSPVSSSCATSWKMLGRSSSLRQPRSPPVKVYSPVLALITLSKDSPD